MKDKLQRYAVYHSSEILAWEKRWFAANNSVFGLMQQAAYALCQKILNLIIQQPNTMHKIQIWCGAGNNAGDGYLLGTYLKQAGLTIEIFSAFEVISPVAQQAVDAAQQQNIPITHSFPHNDADLCIDALFGIGLNRPLDAHAQEIIQRFNQQQGLKIALDVPSGLHPDTGVPLPIAVQANFCLTLMALKAGLFLAEAQSYVGELHLLPLIPTDPVFTAIAHVDFSYPRLPQRLAHQHKGNFGHVLVIGGHPTMGGAVLLSAEAAISCGAGKVTVLCAAQHHPAIIARSPNLMTQDIASLDRAQLTSLLAQVDVVCFGMGLGRDTWATGQFDKIMAVLAQQQQLKAVILDADALWFIAQQPKKLALQSTWIASPHSAEAAKLLACSVAEIENNRIAAIKKLQDIYAGQWILKGAGSLTLENDDLDICAFGNAGMATAGMGDILSGMLAGLKAQFTHNLRLAELVALHALAGDYLAQYGQRGIQAQHMPEAIHYVVNLGVKTSFDCLKAKHLL